MFIHAFRASCTRALALGAALVVAGCNMDALGNNEGRVRLVVTRDAGGATANLAVDSTGAVTDQDENSGGVWAFQTATVTLSSILVRTDEGVLVNLDVDLPVDVDVVKIDGGKQVTLPDGILPVGNYDQVVLVMTAVHGTTRDGTDVTIQPPGGGWTAVIPICPLEVAEGSTATVGITLNARNSFVRLGNWWSFQPRFRSHLNCE